MLLPQIVQFYVLIAVILPKFVQLNKYLFLIQALLACSAFIFFLYSLFVMLSQEHNFVITYMYLSLIQGLLSLNCNLMVIISGDESHTLM